MRAAKREQRQALVEVAAHGPADLLDFWRSPIQRAEGRHGHLFSSYLFKGHNIIKFWGGCAVCLRAHWCNILACQVSSDASLFIIFCASFPLDTPPPSLALLLSYHASLSLNCAAYHAAKHSLGITTFKYGTCPSAPSYSLWKNRMLLTLQKATDKCLTSAVSGFKPGMMLQIL